MRYSDNRSFTIELEPGESVEKLLTALAIANIALGMPVQDDGAFHADFKSFDLITSEEAGKYVHGNEVSMVFAKGRLCLIHVVARPLTSGKVALTFVSYDESVDRLMQLADQVLARLVAADVTIEEVPVTLDDIDDATQVDISLDLNEFLADCGNGRFIPKDASVAA